MCEKDFCLIYKQYHKFTILHFKIMKDIIVWLANSHLNCSKTAFWQRDSMTVNFHCHVSEPGNWGHPTVLIFSLDAEEWKPCQLPARPSQQVRTRPLEMIEKAVEGVVMRVTKHHTGAGASWLAVKGPFLLLAGFQLPTWSFLAMDLVVNVQAATSLQAEVGQPEVFTPSVISTWKDRNWQFKA